jgi:hypothetical protein
MKKSVLDFTCRKCSHTLTTWREMGPNDVHAYKVSCMSCDAFYKWGTKDDLRKLKRARKAYELIPCEVRILK